MSDNTIRDIKVLSGLGESLEKAGFGKGPCTFGSLLQHVYGTDLLRQFYLATMGLGEFRLKTPQIINMLGRGEDLCDGIDNKTPWGAAHDDVWNRFTAVHYGPAQLFCPRFNLSRASLFLPLLLGEKEISLDKALSRVKRSYRSLGTVWQMQWFFRHQEFVPAQWKKVLAAEGRIIFPGTILYAPGDGRPHGEATEHYPFLSYKPGTRTLDYSQEFFLSNKLHRGKDFIARLPRISSD